MDRLLTDEEIIFELNCSKEIIDTYNPQFLYLARDIAKAQDVKGHAIDLVEVRQAALKEVGKWLIKHQVDWVSHIATTAECETLLRGEMPEEKP